MINLLYIPCVICLFILTGCPGSREDILYGDWRLQTVLMNGKPLEDSLQYNVAPNTRYTFFYFNSLTITAFVSGQPTTSFDGYYFFKDRSTLEMKYTLWYERYDITAKIKKLTKRELNLEYEDNGNTYFLTLYSN
jgi:hypothetical protein